MHYSVHNTKYTSVICTSVHNPALVCSVMQCIALHCSAALHPEGAWAANPATAALKVIWIRWNDPNIVTNYIGINSRINTIDTNIDSINNGISINNNNPDIINNGRININNPDININSNDIDIINNDNDIGINITITVITNSVTTVITNSDTTA